MAVAARSSAVAARSYDGAVFGSGGLVFGGGGDCLPGSDLDRRFWIGVIMDSTAKPLLVWPGEGTKRRQRTGSSSTGSATL